jgi:hypothetical protein
MHNRRKRAAVRKELIENTPFVVPFIENDIINKEPDTVEDNEVEFFPTDPHPFRTGKMDSFSKKEKWMASSSMIHYKYSTILIKLSI